MYLLLNNRVCISSMLGGKQWQLYVMKVHPEMKVHGKTDRYYQVLRSLRGVVVKLNQEPHVRSPVFRMKVNRGPVSV